MASDSLWYGQPVRIILIVSIRKCDWNERSTFNFYEKLHASDPVLGLKTSNFPVQRLHVVGRLSKCQFNMVSLSVTYSTCSRWHRILHSWTLSGGEWKYTLDATRSLVWGYLLFGDLIAQAHCGELTVVLPSSINRLNSHISVIVNFHVKDL